MKILPIFILGIMIITSGLAAPAGSSAGPAPYAWPQIDLVETAGGLDQPVHLAHAGDGSGRLFVVEQPGRIRIVKNGTIQGTFLDISNRVRTGGEQGLLSVAFPPDFAAGSSYFYVYYTNRDGDNQVSRFSLGANPDQANPASEKLIIKFDHPTNTNHNGGQLVFGPDGYLYIGTGDGGGEGDPKGNAQNPGSLLGKLLRIGVAGDPPPVEDDFLVYLPLVTGQGTGGTVKPAYTIPPDNPFVGKPGYRGEIWALGLRNPWRFSFDRQTGDLFIGDVGQHKWEEIDFQPASSGGGENYGWNILEGFDCYFGPPCDDTGMTPPIDVYTHTGGNCSVTGGFVYRGSQHPALQGIYLYADYCSGKIWGLQRENNTWNSQELEDTNYFISSFGEGPDGKVYVLDRAGGKIYEVIVPTR